MRCLIVDDSTDFLDAARRLLQQEGIAVAGPRAFGYEFDYLPVEELAGATA